jgi:hypothetical protein
MYQCPQQHEAGCSSAPLSFIGLLQQTMWQSSQPHDFVTVTSTPHVSQYSVSPACTGFILSVPFV